MEYVYYVYSYHRRDGSPYYIGKGKDRRAYDKQHAIRPPRDKSLIYIVERGLSEVGALALERRLIRWYGRKDQGTGVLWNMTDGGEGVCEPSPDTIAKRRVTMMERYGSLNAWTDQSPKRARATKERNGTLDPHPPEVRAKIWEKRRQNGTDKRSPESYVKGWETRRNNQRI